MSHPRFVKISKFSEMTGYTKEAVYQKCSKSDWSSNGVIITAPDNNYLVDLEKYEQWAQGALKGLRQEVEASALPSLSTVSVDGKPLKRRPRQII